MRKVKRIIKLTAILAMTVMLFTGCMYEEDHIIIHKDGTGMISSRVELEKSAVDQFISGMGMSEAEMSSAGLNGAAVEIVDGIECYVVEESAEFDSMASLKALLEEKGYLDVYADVSGIRYLFKTEVSTEDVKMMESAGFDMADFMSVKIMITMPTEILVTTGTLSEDKMTAEFCFEGSDFYSNQDIVVSCEAENTKPAIRGATHKKTYNSARTITAADASGIKKIQYKYKKSEDSEYGKYKTFDLSKTFTKNGVYTVRAEDYYGNRATRTFIIHDTKKPAVEGVTNKKTYSAAVKGIVISDNCAVKSVKYYVNGESREITLSEVLEKGISASEKGTHKITVTDVNGNKRTVNFSIK